MQRLSAGPGLIGVICVFPVLVWWFPQIMLTQSNGGLDITADSQRAMEVLLLLQLLSIALFAPRWMDELSDEVSTMIGTARMALGVCVMIAPAWPALTVFWLATEVSPAALLLAELLALSAGVVIGLLSRSFRRVSASIQTLQQVRILFGVILAGILWFWHEGYLAWLLR